MVGRPGEGLLGQRMQQNFLCITALAALFHRAPLSAYPLWQVR